MIDPKELRIGNIIWDNTRQKIKYVNHRVINDLASHYSPLPYSPIPLSEESLLALGLIKRNDTFLIKVGDFYYSVDCTNGHWCLYNDESTADCYKIAVIKSIHQLQNILFDIEGIELPINE